MSYIFLASPYSHPLTGMREQRYKEALSALNWLLDKQLWTYCPIVHCHHLAEDYKLPFSADHWSDYNRLMLLQARALIVLTIPGYTHSVGVQDEVLYAQNLDKPIHYICRTRPNSPFYHISKSPSVDDIDETIPHYSNTQLLEPKL